MKKFTLLFLALILIAALGACSENNVTAASSVDTSQPSATAVANTTASEDAADDTVTTITLGESIAIDGAGAEAVGSTLNITSGGTYSLSGQLPNGQVNVDTKEKVKLRLNGVAINNTSGPALLITDAKKVTLTLEAGTTNTLADAKNGGENDAALFTNDTLVIKGEGTLVVTGNNREGISSDDDIIIENGTVRVSAPDDGLNAHDDITISGGYVFVSAGGDAIDSNGTVNISGGTIFALGSTAGGDGGVDAMSTFTITGGTLIATGNTDAAPAGASTQASVYVNTNAVLAAGTLLHIEQDGNPILTFAPAKNYQTVLYSSPTLSAGAAYQAYTGGSSSGTAVDGLYSGGAYTPPGGGTALALTAAIVPSGVGEMMGGPHGGMGGPPPGGMHP